MVRQKCQDITETISNEQVAAALDEIAHLLELQLANPFRIAAYKSAAGTISKLSPPLQELFGHGGIAALQELPGIGESIGRSIAKLLRTGRLPRLERLQRELIAQDELTALPGVGPELAERIRQNLRVETLSDLAAAAYDGRLDRVPGMGRKRMRAIRETLANRFGRGLDERPYTPVRPDEEPPIAELLDLDTQYREQAEAGTLQRTAPRQYNPTGAAWLPVMHAERDSRHYTVLYSNSARAHQLAATRDWVVIYRGDRGQHGQWTVVTASYGPLRGRRIVRGREPDCRRHYEQVRSQLFLPLDAPE
jgi:hypothetical protein